MGDEDHRRVQRLELSLQPFEALDVEVVRGLVEEEQVRIARQRPGERSARQLSSGEGGELTVEVGVDEAEATDGRGDAVPPGPPAGVLQPALCFRVAAKRGLVVGPALHRLLESTELRFDPEEVLGPRERVLPERQAELARRPLVVERDPRSLREGELTALERRLAGDRTQQRRLARAVGSGEREPVLPAHGERDAGEERITGELLAQVRCDENGHGETRRKGRCRAPPAR